MSMLSPITVAQAGPIMAKAYGIDWVDRRSEVLDLLNKYRAILYTEYDRLKLFDNVFHRMCVQDFPECYRGITLPADILSVQAIWQHGTPLTLHSRWREAHDGIGLQGEQLASVLMAETFPTEREPKIVGKLRLFTEHADDNDKLVHMDVVIKGGRQRRLVFKLVHDGWTVSPVRVEKILSVSLPTGRSGAIRLAQEDGYELSIYTPHESAPMYRRIKLEKSCTCPTVVVQGTKKFAPVWFDHDLVEVGNPLVIEECGKFFKYGDSTSDTKEIQTAEYHRKMMNSYLAGEHARHQGRSQQDATPIKINKRFRKKALPGYQKRK